MRLPLLLSVKAIILGIFVLASLAFNPSERRTKVQEVELQSKSVSLEALATYDEFKIRSGSYKKESHSVKRGETFSDILNQFGISNAQIAELVDKSTPHLNVRKIRAGNRYYTYHANDSSNTPRFVVYEKDAVDYVVIDLQDSMRVVGGTKSITRAQRRIEGLISHSLYQTLEELDANPLVAIELSEIFAWQVDFYRIVKGDKFNVVYEEEFVGDKSVGISHIIAASFFHNGREYNAFPFEADGRIEYYDEAGNSLRRPFLKAPLRFNRISSRYSLRRFHPVQKRYKAHLGTDYAAPTGTPVQSTADGVVIEAGYTKGNGRYVKVRHNSTYTTGYLHFSKIAGGIQKGVRVQQGDIIGYVGSTGLATGPHLCYRFWKNGKQVDPLREKLPDTVEPIAEKYRDTFLAHVQDLHPLLDGESQPALQPRPIVYRPLFDELIAIAHSPETQLGF